MSGPDDVVARPRPRPPAGEEHADPLQGVHDRPLGEQVAIFERVHAELLSRLQGSEG